MAGESRMVTTDHEYSGSRKIESRQTDRLAAAGARRPQVRVCARSAAAFYPHLHTQSLWALMYAPSLARPPPECRLGDACPHYALGQCRFTHSIPGAAVSAAAAGAAIGSTVPCRYGAACTRQATCRYTHPPRAFGAPVACRFGPNCARRSECRFTHPAAEAAQAASSALAMLVPENALCVHALTKRFPY